LSEREFDFAGLFAKGIPSPVTSVAVPQPKFNFILGHTSPDLIPVEQLIDSTARALRKDGPGLAINLYKGGPMGYLPLRELLVKRLALHRGLNITSDDLIITSGSQTAIVLINSAFLESGDTVVMENFSYIGMLGDQRARGINIVGVKMDDHGMQMDDLSSTLDDLHVRGVRPKYIYTIPTVHNPTGTIMPMERRLEMLRLSQQYNVPIIEDDCYSDLIFENFTPPAIKSLSQSNNVIYIGSFSKNLAPGLRLGYIVAPWVVLSRLLPLKGDLGSSNFGQMVVADFFENHADQHLKNLRNGLRNKRDSMIAALKEHFGPSVSTNFPSGGIYLWVKFPKEVDTRKPLEAARKEGIGYNPGPDWAVSPSDDLLNGYNYIRFCYALPSEAEIWEGIGNLAKVFQDEIGFPEVK